MGVNIPDEHATIVLFEGRNEREGFYFYGEVTAPDCIPVANGFYSNKTGYEHTDSSISLAESQIQLFSSPHKDASLCRIKQPRDNAYFNSPLVVFIGQYFLIEDVSLCCLYSYIV